MEGKEKNRQREHEERKHLLGEDMEKDTDKKSHFPIMSFPQNIELGSVNGRGPGGSGGGWPQSCLNERVCCLMSGEGDEKEEGDGEFVGHQPLSHCLLTLRPSLTLPM